MERQKALAADEGASKENPVMTSEGLERMGDFYVRQGNLPMAFLQYDKALRLDRNQPDIHYKMGRLFLEKGMAEEAQNEFLEVLKVNPQHAQAFEGRGWVYFKTAILKRPRKTYNRPSLLRIPYAGPPLLGIIYDRQQNYEEAIQQYRKAISLKPNIAMLFNNLGMCLLLKGDYNEALKFFLEALKLEGLQ